MSVNPQEPDASTTPRPPLVPVDASATGDAATEPVPPVEVLPTGCTDGATRPCGPSTESGECMLGARLCTDGVWGECLGAVMPGARMCGDSADNDCDGQPDDSSDTTCECVPGTSQPCDTHPGLDGVGDCKAGERTCVEGADGTTSRWGACTGSRGPAAADSCSVRGDANCDATPNGGCECVDGEEVVCGPQQALGICKFGKSRCVNSRFTTCADAVLPRARDCSSALDNDCDGKPDNTIDATCTCAVGSTEACGGSAQVNGVGICKAGSRTCVAENDGASSKFGLCTGVVSPKPRDCTSAADNNCDRKPDNQLDTTCACVPGDVAACDEHSGLDGVGHCLAGHQECVLSSDKASSAYTACVGAVPPLAADSCSVLNDDSNCDGTKNGGCECVAAEGNQRCTRPAASRCSATGTCVACAANGDCSHLTGLGICNGGVCVECSADRDCRADAVCNPATHACEAAPPSPPADAGP